LDKATYFFSLHYLVPTFYAGRRPDNSTSSFRFAASSPAAGAAAESGYHSGIAELTGFAQNFP
jgi:hypothetical protein